MTARPALAISLYVSGRRCVVIGDDSQAEERARRLRQAGAEVLTLPAASFEPGTCRGAFFVACCDPSVASAASADARAHGALFYALDLPDLSDLALPALAQHGPVTLAISTDGRAPVLARRLREELERLLTSCGNVLDTFVEELVQRREKLPREGRKDLLYAVAKRLRIEGRIIVEPTSNDPG
ncbi:MAG: hypothetical protein HY698_06720 [Deltaproteobacteria bacterium]|nr:hypothetical protein [Deltaproteobacteria bacterium]